MSSIPPTVTADIGSISAPRASTHSSLIENKNHNISHLHGSGSIKNNIRNITNVYAGSSAPPAAYISDVRTTAVLPPRPIVFHGRDEFVDDAVGLLTVPSPARLAILGAGGMGKTTVTLAILHDNRVVAQYGNLRYFISCEALVDADGMVVSLAKVLKVPASNDLLSDVIIHLTDGPRAVIVLDNLETTWLGESAAATVVEELLGRLAQIPSLSLIITCRGTDLPQTVEWSNENNAILEPFSIDAALQTFRERAKCSLSGTDEDTAKLLLDAVDRMPLAVSLLAQLARRGNTLSELLERWHREHSDLLRTHGTGRMNSVEVSIELSIVMLCTADDSREALHLLSLCCMLPDGLRPDVFKQLRTQFEYIDRARDTLCGYALVSLGKDRTLKTLSPIRHHVLQRYPAERKYHDALCSIYFDIARRLPAGIDERFKQLAESVAPEMGNLSSLLLSLVNQPSEQIVDAVLRFSNFACLQKPSTTLAFALLPHLGDHPLWKARCLYTLGGAQSTLDEYRDATSVFLSAAQLFSVTGYLPEVAECKKLAGEAYRMIGETNKAEMLLKEALAECTHLNDEFQVAQCRLHLGDLKRQQKDYAAASGYVNEARQTLRSLGHCFSVALCSECIGEIHLDQDNLDSAVTEFETARATFVSLGMLSQLPQCTRYLSQAYRRKHEFVLAEQLLCEAEAICKKVNDRSCIAGCVLERGRLLQEQERYDEAIVYIASALHLHEMLGRTDDVGVCRLRLSNIEPLFRASKVTTFT